ncbi:MAG: hypothetical protein VX642_01890, partial [Bdellovibrionota bacterium]|nr:hypothetical protein [Bdellovibrionota bacterium]
MNRFLTSLLFVFVLASCGGQGNELLESGSLGVAIDVLSGNNQTADPSTIINDPVVVVVKDALGTPIPFMNIEVTEITSTDSEVVSTTFETDANGQVEIRVRSSSVYGEEAQFRVSIAGTSDFTTFAVLNGKGDIYRYEVTTSEGDTLIAGEEFKFIINALDDQNNIVLELGTSDTPVNIAMYWEFNHEKSWGGFKATLPPQLQPFECKFIEGVCTSTLNYKFTDSSRPTYVSVGDGDGGAIDVFQKPFTVNTNVEAGFYLAQAQNGPNFVYNGLTETWDNLGAETWYQSPEGNPYSADDTAIRLYAVTIDKAGNYVRDAIASDGVSYEGIKHDDNSAYNRMSDVMTPAADGTYVDFDPTLMMYDSYSGAIRISGNVFNGFKSGQVQVNPGAPAVLDFTSDNNFVEVAGEIFGIGIYIYDAHGNLQVTTPTQAGLNGTLDLSYTVYNYITGNGAAMPSAWAAGGFDFGTIHKYSASETGIGMTVLEGIVPSNTIRRTFMDASNTAPYIDFQLDMDDNPGTFEDESFTLTGTTPTFTVNVGVPYRYNVYRDDGDPATNPRMCFTIGANIQEVNLRCHDMSLPSGTAPRDYYIAMEDRGGNVLANNSGTWELANVNGDAIPFTGVLKCVSAACQPNLNISNSTYVPISSFTVDYDFIGFVNFQTNDPLLDQIRGFDFSVTQGALDHYKVVVTDNEGAGTSNVYATDNSFSLYITSHDEFGNQIYDTGSRNFTMNITSGGPIEDAPNGSTTANFSSFSTTFDNSSTVTGFRLPNSDKNSTVVLTIEDENGIQSQSFSINVIPGVENEIRIHSAADPNVGSTYVNELISINTDQTRAMYSMSHDAMGNFIQLVNATWTAFDGLENQVEPLAAGADFEAILDPHTTGTGGKIRASYGGRSAETDIVSVEPGAFFSIVVSDHAVTAGVAQTVSVELVDAEQNVLTNFSGNKNLVISVIDNDDTLRGYDHSKAANGSYNFVNGVLDPAHQLTLYNSSETPRLRYETEGKIGTSNPWAVVNNVPDHVYVFYSGDTVDAGSDLTTYYRLSDIYGNRI